MPARSKSQQRLFGMVHAFKTGKLKRVSKKIREIAKHVSDEDAKHFAETAHDGLPEKKAALAERYRIGFMKRAEELGFVLQPG